MNLPTPSLHKQFIESVQRSVRTESDTMGLVIRHIEDDEVLRAKYSDLYAEAKRIQHLSASLLVILEGYGNLIGEANPMIDEFIERENHAI